jgi:YVTN family beta-propeller protein
MRKILISSILAIAGLALIAAESGLFPVLKSDARIGKQPAGFFLLPTNQLLRPWGELLPLQGRPVDLAFDSRKRLLAILNSKSVNLMDGSTGTPVAEIKARTTSYAGVAFSPGGRELWASEVTRKGPDSLLVAQLSDVGVPGKVDHIELPGHPIPVGIAFAGNGGLAYVAFSHNNSLAMVDTQTRKVRQEVPVGMAPFAVAVSEKQGRIFVSNRGGRRPVASDTTAPSAGSFIVTDPVTGASSTGTLSVLDIKTHTERQIAVGLAPSGMALSPDEKFLAVANGHSDSISIVDAAKLSVVAEVKIPTWPESAIGSQPDGVVFATDGKTIYVACGGNNAIAIVTRGAKGWQVAGAVPTAWFPSALGIDREGALRIVSIKGVGNTANQKGSYNSKQYEGSLGRIPAPLPPQIAAGTREVRAANTPQFEPAGGVSNLASLGIGHVILIVKENRTYDQVFGDIAKANGDPKLVMYGREITPNHHALAEKYVVLDNLHCGGAISFDGHQWLLQGFVSDYVERAFAASPRGYAWNMADALTVSPQGFFWQHAPKPVSVRIYGEMDVAQHWNPLTQNADEQNAAGMNEGQQPGWLDYLRLYKEGKWQAAVGNAAGVPALDKLMDHHYPNSNTKLPDQLRAAEFLREFGDFEKSGKLPQLMLVHLNSDHTNGTRPGSATPHAMVSDNDLALGRVVERVSKSRFWPKTLILVVEDDAQDGLDHVDGHRTVALAIGPHIRRAAVDSTFYNHTSMVRTIQTIFGIPPRTRFLQSARAMTSVFTTEADLSPYQCITPATPLDEMNPPLKALKGRQLWAARQSLAMNWDQPDDVPSDILNRILWWDAKGYDKPYPKMR